MRTNAQTLPVTTWETGPDLKVVDGKEGTTAKPLPTPIVFRRARPEQEVLNWEARAGRLASLSRSR